MNLRKFVILWLNHFVPMCKRYVQLMFRKEDLPQITLIDSKDGEWSNSAKTYVQALTLSIRATNVYAIRLNQIYIPVFEDELEVRITLPLEPGKNMVEVKALGFFKSRQQFINLERRQVEVVKVFPPKNYLLKSGMNLRILTPKMSQVNELKLPQIRPKAIFGLRSAALGMSSIKSIKQPKLSIPLTELQEEIKHRVKTEIKQSL